MKPQANSHGGGWGSPRLHLRGVPSQSPPHRPQQGEDGDLYDLHQVIWLRSVSPDPGLKKNSLREAMVLCEQQGIPFQKPANLRQ